MEEAKIQHSTTAEERYYRLAAEPGRARYYRGSADVKNYIHPYYRKGVALAWWAAVVRLQGSGTTVSTSGTTAPPRGTTADAYSTTVDPGAVLPQPTTAASQRRQENGGSSKEEGGDKRRRVRDDSTRTFPTRTPS